MSAKIKTIPTGEFQENCYFYDLGEGKCFVIDPGCDAEYLISELKDEGLSPTAILLTHAHFDHISAVKQLVDAFDIPVYLHPDDIPLYTSPMNCMPPSYPPQNRPDTVSWDDWSIDDVPCPKIIFTPGHTPGGCCILFPDENVMFTGDTLFNLSIGRTDLPGGDYLQLMESIRNQLLPLDDDIRFYPGHGPSSTIGVEKAQNPFLQI